MRLFWRLVIVVLAICVVAWLVVVVVPLRDPHPQAKLASGLLAIREARIYVSPDAPALEHATLLVRDGRIAAVGETVAVPEGAQVLACEGCTVVAGFWNAHVHFTEPKWQWAAYKNAPTLNAQLADMLTSRGVTTAIDLGSDLRNTVSLRRRVEAGELQGPAIYTAGSGLFPPQGIPYYVRDSTPRLIQFLMPQPGSTAEAREAVKTNIGRGADVLKLFTGSWVDEDHVKPMPVEIARAAVEAAHEAGQIAFAHPSNLVGTVVARDGGVDILAHAPSSTRGVDEALLRSLVERHLAMIPTLKMFATTVTTKDSFLQPIYAEVRQFRAMGGELIFGTDVGYMRDYRTEDEFAALAASGLEWRDMLRMLTTAPAGRMGVKDEKGTLEAGKVADFVVLGDDPARDVKAFSKVVDTVRGGRVLFGANGGR